MASDRVKESIVVAAGIGAVYDIVTNYETYPEWMDEFKQVDVLAHGAQGRAAKVAYILSAMGITVHMTLAYTYETDRVQWELVDGDLITANDGSYHMTDRGDGTTLLTYELNVQTTVPMPGIVRRRFAKRTVDESLRSVKQHAES